ncbi:MAG: 4-hydroxy-3-methylbut-2-en-1-yl diphosphate synthase [Prevotella sp.]
MTDLFQYNRRQTTEVNVGSIRMGSNNPIRIQSMATTNTNDTEASVQQAIRIIKAGGELVRFTTQGTREAENMRNINAGIRAQGFLTPIVADVHFNANVADVAARYAEKVRINPGNYVDPARKFEKISYTDEEYAQEIKKIESRLVPLLDICKANHTALRIGVNHGSLSDRIRNRYGDTPQGIVESCMEFLRICRDNDFHDIVISIKSSNTVVMVQAVRLLVDAMDNEDMHYPLHLGVTEAGEGEDGRIKSAVGIGALLADGIGDTIRVSLSEEPEAEIPVARHLVDYITKRQGHMVVPAVKAEAYDWLHPSRRKTVAVENIGGDSLPIVITSEEGAKADYVYVGSRKPETDGRKYIVDYNAYDGTANTYPIFPAPAMPFISAIKAPLKFLVLQFGTPADEYLACLRLHPEVVVVCVSNHQNKLACQRALVSEMMQAGVTNPVVFAQMYSLNDKETFQLDAAADMGALMMDGLTDGLWLMNNGTIAAADIEDTAFAILQAARLRSTRTEYISCPGCGRTLYNLQQTIARIKQATSHLKGLKIGIMGCIVNGPGEMADADYGYVGAGPGKVSLYKKQVCVEKNIPEDEAVDRLLELIEKTLPTP